MPNQTAYRQRAQQRTAFWRLVFSGHFTYSEVAAMDWDEFWEAYGALASYDRIMPKQKSRKR